MLTRPKNILTHIVEGTLSLRMIDGLLPGGSPGGGVEFRRADSEAGCPFLFGFLGVSGTGKQRLQVRECIPICPGTIPVYQWANNIGPLV